MAQLIKTDGSSRKVTPQNGVSFTLAELQGYVGGYVQEISLPSGKSMLMDEEGKFKGKPVNGRATPMASAAGTMRGNVVVGDVLICDESELN